jgi:hypothetical protein
LQKEKITPDLTLHRTELFAIIVVILDTLWQIVERDRMKTKETETLEEAETTIIIVIIIIEETTTIKEMITKETEAEADPETETIQEEIDLETEVKKDGDQDLIAHPHLTIEM